MTVYIVTGLAHHDVYVFSTLRRAQSQKEYMDRMGDSALIHEKTVNEGDCGEATE